MSRPSSVSNLQASTSQAVPPPTAVVASQPTTSASGPTMIEHQPPSSAPRQITVVDTAGNSISQEAPAAAEGVTTSRPLTSDQLKYTFLDIHALASRVVNSMPENVNGLVDEEVLTLISNVFLMLMYNM